MSIQIKDLYRIDIGCVSLFSGFAWGRHQPLHDPFACVGRVDDGIDFYSVELSRGQRHRER